MRNYSHQPRYHPRTQYKSHLVPEMFLLFFSQRTMVYTSNVFPETVMYPPSKLAISGISVNSKNSKINQFFSSKNLKLFNLNQPRSRGFFDLIHLSRIVVIEIFSFFSSKTDYRFEFLVKTYVYAGNFSLIQ